MENEFKSLRELYDKVRPALVTKRNEFKKYNMDYIKEEDIWNCLKEKKWKHTVGLSLSELVDDILNIDKNTIEIHMREQLKKIEPIINLDE